MPPKKPGSAAQTVVLPLQFALKEGGFKEVPQATMAEIHKAKDEHVPAGWNDTDVVKVEWTGSLDWKKPRRGGPKKRCIKRVIVEEEAHYLMKAANTVKGNNKKHVLPVRKMHFLPKGEKPARKDKTGTEGSGGWLQGDDCGPKLREVFENSEATKDELLAAADQYVRPPKPRDYNVKDGCFLLISRVAGRRLGKDIHYGCVGPTDAVAREDAQIQALGNCLSWRDTDHIEKDPIYKRMKRVCPAIQAAARLSLLKKPYKGKKGPGRLDKFTVTVLTAQEKAIQDKYVKKCKGLNRVPLVDGAEVPSRSFNNVDGREGRKNHAAVRLGVERALQLVPVDAAVRGAVDASV
jgi:hypothetical protein